MELSKLLLTNYLPYAKATIISRAIPEIDGLKPVQRRLLYTMYKLSLLKGDRAKSQKINGATMAIHPHGDSSIYEAGVLMTTDYDGLNVPYIDSKGSFGKKYSSDLKCSAPRYTEEKLAEICKELFEGINEDSVPFVDNFDGTEREPRLLPIKFPSILINSNSGVAVGTSSNIPSFSLNNVCAATIGILQGSITDARSLSKVLGSPEFTTGGYLHSSEDQLVQLCETGKGSFKISGKVEVYSDRIVVTEVPYGSTVEGIMEDIDANMKEKRLKGVRDVQDEIGIDGLRLIILIKNGYNSREVLAELCRLTSIRDSISFRTRVIAGNRCKEVNLLELLKLWIEFRSETLTRVYNYRIGNDTKDANLLEAWEKIADKVAEVVGMIGKSTDSEAKDKLIKVYGLDEVQAEYLLDMRIRSITTDRAEAAIIKLAKLRDKIAENTEIIESKDGISNVIVSELQEISAKYGKANKTALVAELEEDEEAGKVKISDEDVVVVMTKEGYLRRLITLKDIADKFVSRSGDAEVMRWTIKNNEHLLVFDRYGTVHKILVDDIDASSKSVLTDKLYEMAGLEKADDIIWADACGDYSKYFNIVYGNGKGIRVHYSKASGNRKAYKSLYDEVTRGNYWVTSHDKFFMVTNRLKASYCDIEKLGMISVRTAFKVGRSSAGDFFVKLQPAVNVPNLELINLSKYDKDYTVLIGDDELFLDKERVAEEQKLLREKLNSFKKAAK